MNNVKIDCIDYIINGENKVFTVDETDITKREVETENNSEIYATFFIKCDNQDDNKSFLIDSYADDNFVIDCDRCKVNVYIKENKTPFDKLFNIICKHANDINEYIQITILQKAEKFSIEITDGAEMTEENKYIKTLNSIITQPKYIGNENRNRKPTNYNYYEEALIYINVNGGSKKYKITSILRCHFNTDTNDENPTLIYLPFDDGFVYFKTKNYLKIINYGRPFMSKDDYYLLKIEHEDYRDASIELKLNYI